MDKKTRIFNITGACFPEDHYMVDTTSKLSTIVHDLIERGDYFTINRPRQYGKTTTLRMLRNMLADEYLVISISFEGRDTFFESFTKFEKGLKSIIKKRLKTLDGNLEKIWNEPLEEEDPLKSLRERISALCSASAKRIVLMIDEVDKPANYQVFNAFLGILRDMYTDRKESTAFQSAI